MSTPQFTFAFPRSSDPLSRQKEFEREFERFLLLLNKKIANISSQVAQDSTLYHQQLIFSSSLTGFILLGNPSNNRYRILLDDPEGTPIVSIEDVSGLQPEDIVFPSSAVGPVIQGRNQTGWFRFGVNDQEGPRLLVTALTPSGFLAADYIFFPGMSWANKTRVNDQRYQFLVPPELTISVEDY